MNDHYDDGKVYVDNASYYGPAFACACGAIYVEHDGLLDHLQEKRDEEERRAILTRAASGKR